jgi:PAS domain S-box-containing protein
MVPNPKDILKNLVFRNAISLILVLLLLSLIAWIGYGIVERELKNNLSQHLLTTLNGNIESIKLWKQDKIKDAKVLANKSDIHKNILSLVNKVTSEDWPLEKILATSEAKILRRELGKASASYGFVGFVLFNKNNFQILALLDGATGKSDLVKYSDFPKLALEGQSVVSLPFMSELPLSDIKGKIHSRFPTMFVAEPIRDSSDNVVAVLSFRIRPEIEFNKLMRISRFGESGETYAFNKKGKLLSESRFNEHLKKIGLLPSLPNVISTLNIDVRDPGVNLTKGFTTQIPREKQSLTLMAKASISGSKGFNVDGYNDYRGVPVVGAWSWLPEFNMGITTEVDYDEAFEPLNSLQNVFFILLILLTLTTFIALWFIRRNQLKQNQLNEQVEKLVENDNYVKTIIHSMVEGVITINQDGIIQTFNYAAEQIFGYSSSETVGRNVKMLMEGKDKEQHDEYLQRYLKTMEPRIIGVGREVKGRKRNGALFDMDLSISQLNQKNEKLFVGSVRDITERKKVEEEIKNARIEAEAANRAKSEFLANMSHEIRTPMNAILGYAQILKRKNLENEDKKSVGHILSSGDHLLKLINNILDISKIEAGKMEVTYVDFDLTRLIKNLSDMFVPKCEQKKIKFQIEGASKEPVIVNGDETKFTQVLINLIGNAVKFTNDGTITLQLSVEKNNRYRFDIIDTGEGIPAKAQKDIFEPFRQDWEGLNKGGTGLGLAIAKRQVEIMNGSLELFSEEGKGSRFSLSLTLLPSNKENVSNNEENSGKKIIHLAPGYTVKALVVDDIAMNREVLKETLEDVGITVITANNGQEGVDKVREFAPNIVFMDMRMPVMNGVDALNIIKNEFSSDQIKVVAITASALQHQRKTIENSGADGFISKPFKTAELFQCIKDSLQVEYVYEDESADDDDEEKPKTLEIDISKITISENFYTSLKNSAEMYLITQMERLLKKLEEESDDGKILAEIIEPMMEQYDMDGILKILEKTQHEK